MTTEQLQDKVERQEAVIRSLVGTLREIACLDDAGANGRLAETGSYGGFDEPGAVQTARAALIAHGVLEFSKPVIRVLGENGFEPL